ncbi:uncharacterized protein LOC143361965 [Halictus rubicundus]|uniref:uncharacterized protein LOC143361965 n=1 Tax=Halictus rubicundus TaxID=77578 RepID=UPI004036111A
MVAVEEWGTGVVEGITYRPQDPLSDPLADSNSSDGCLLDKLPVEGTANRRVRSSPRKSKAKDTNDDSTSPNRIVPWPPKIRSSGPFRCDHCGKEILRKYSLVMHLKTCIHRRRIHDQVFRLRNYPCTMCKYKSTTKRTLTEHIIRKHTSNYDYSCTVCQKKFKMKCDLRQHTKETHTNAPPVICRVCGQASKNPRSLKDHMRYRHYTPPFKCSICKRYLSTQISLEKHLVWHEKKEKLTCSTCGKTFGKKRDLGIHVMIHEGLKPFSCPFCSKTFRREFGQEQHILIHTGMRPYRCDICGRDFTQKSALICHRRIHPGPLPPLPVISVKKLIMDYTQGLQTVPRGVSGE